MAANVMLIAVMVMAIVGVSYFLIEDKKNICLHQNETYKGIVIKSSTKSL